MEREPYQGMLNEIARQEQITADHYEWYMEQQVILDAMKARLEEVRSRREASRIQPLQG